MFCSCTGCPAGYVSHDYILNAIWDVIMRYTLRFSLNWDVMLEIAFFTQVLGAFLPTFLSVGRNRVTWYWAYATQLLFDPCVGLCVWRVCDANCCFCIGLRLPADYVLYAKMRTRESNRICYFSPGDRPYSSSSSIANSRTIKKPSAASISSAVSVGAVAMSKCTQRRVGARPTNSKCPPHADKH